MGEAMSMLRSRVGVAVTGGKLYAFGGFNGSERLSTVHINEIVNFFKLEIHEIIFCRSKSMITRQSDGHKAKQCNVNVVQSVLQLLMTVFIFVEVMMGLQV